jgi:hypothetical protein
MAANTHSFDPAAIACEIDIACAAMAANTHSFDPAASWPPPASLDYEDENAVADWAYAASLADARRRTEIPIYGSFLFKVRRGAAIQRASQSSIPDKIRFTNQSCSVAKKYYDKACNTERLYRKRAVSITDTCSETFSAKRKRLQCRIFVKIAPHNADRNKLISDDNINNACAAFAANTTNSNLITAIPDDHGDVQVNNTSIFPFFNNIPTTNLTGNDHNKDDIGAHSLPTSGDTTGGRVFPLTNNKEKRTTSPTHCSGGPSLASSIISINSAATVTADPSVASSSNHIFNSAATVPADFLPSSNLDPFLVTEELGAFSIITNSLPDTTSHNLLQNRNRGGSSRLGQADSVCPDSVVGVGSHYSRDWLTQLFHPPET